ncbi:MAG: Panacea domain-containing protein [Methylobacter sp.]
MKIEDIVLYICKKYPIPDELSKARLTKLVYLADWESCVRSGKQLTNIEWCFHNFGPYVDDVVDAARNSYHLIVTTTNNFYGEKKELISAKKESQLPRIEKAQAEILNFIIEETKKMYWNDFIKHVYSTPPVSGSTRYTSLNLENFAKETRKLNSLISNPL